MARPTFASAWTAALKIYDPINIGKKVAETIGGNVSLNINSDDFSARWSNTCAVRISYILNETGFKIPAIRTKTVSGGDGRKYFFRVRDVIEFLKMRWGEPDKQVQYPPAGGGELANSKGLVLFEVSGWSDAAGHATLWDGTRCYDECYFNEPGVTYRTDRANFWSLP